MKRDNRGSLWEALPLYLWPGSLHSSSVKLLASACPRHTLQFLNSLSWKCLLFLWCFSLPSFPPWTCPVSNHPFIGHFQKASSWGEIPGDRTQSHLVPIPSHVRLNSADSAPVFLLHVSRIRDLPLSFFSRFVYPNTHQLDCKSQDHVSSIKWWRKGRARNKCRLVVRGFVGR